jgi:hypothetical protein
MLAAMAEQEILRCASCGAPLHADARACAFCGAELAHPPLATGAPRPQSEAVEALRAWVARIAGNVELQFGYVTEEQCAKMGQNFGGKLVALANQILNANAHRLQVNYVHAASPEDASTVYASLVKMVGKSNTVARKAHVVVEIITTDRHAIEPVIEVLRPDEVHRSHHHWL